MRLVDERSGGEGDAVLVEATLQEWIVAVELLPAGDVRQALVDAVDRATWAELESIRATLPAWLWTLVQGAWQGAGVAVD